MPNIIRSDLCFGRRRSFVAVVMVAVGGCQAGPEYTAVADVKQLMAAVIEPAAEAYWDAVGTIDDSTGSHSFAPVGAEEWTAVRNGALIVAESGNLLMMDGRVRDRGDWIVMSRAMIEAGKQALAAARAEDPARVFAAGADLYDTCTRCHAVYATELLRPNAQPPQ
ncbi:MAG: hypothetical protein ACKVZ0_06155 [Gemmatimonadales bacterium]